MKIQGCEMGMALFALMMAKFRVPISVIFIYFGLSVGLHVWDMVSSEPFKAAIPVGTLNPTFSSFVSLMIV